MSRTSPGLVVLLQGVSLEVKVVRTACMQAFKRFDFEYVECSVAKRVLGIAKASTIEVREIQERKFTEPGPPYYLLSPRIFRFFINVA